MLFPTIDFAVFFVIVFTGSWMLRPYAKVWRWFLLLASCVFYLDPFNPVAAEGQQTIVMNLVIIAMTAGAGAITAGLLKAGFGSLGGRSLAEHEHAVRVEKRALALARASQRGDGRYDEADDLDEFEELGGLPDDDAPVRLPAASVWVPLAVVAMLGVGNVVINNAYPGRIDQSSRFLFLLLGVAFANQAFAQAVFAALGPTRERTPGSRWLVRIAVAFDLAVLGYFKYTNWFLGMFESMVSNFGITLPLNIILPIAISFFTFQAIGYVVDVGRGEVRPIPLLDFTVYLTFFAHVVAGPIVRVGEFAPQLNARPDPRFVQSAEAFELIFRGLFKKVVVSSFVSAAIVDPVFATPSAFSKGEVLFAILGYAVQIYADFSGYTDIAIGVALLLGIRFPQNFNAPYRALSLQDFWRRWHMTLSRWLRDYLYIPLGGNRKSTIFGSPVGEVRTYLNLFLTMVIGGLWHGANWTFIVWGFIHGAWLAVERFIKERWARRAPLGVPLPIVKALQWAVTFVIVCAAWVFFRATSFENAFAIFSQLFTGEGTVGAVSRVDLAKPAGLALVVVIILMLLSQWVPDRIPQRISVLFAQSPPMFQVLCAAVGLTIINVLGPEGVPAFIYFQF
jgi:D-alanyl-lipoteichoic acid acyltransferase DltB (MBOAT superfamily)